MSHSKSGDLQLKAERAVLVQVMSRRDRYDPDETFRELESLTRTAGALIMGQLRQRRDKQDRRYYVGKGKMKELQELCAQVEADVVVCDDELTPAQVRMIEAELGTKVVDRSEVILDIFAAHARTRQAQLQVELAQLEYEFPRLKQMWTHLDRTAGGTLGGPVGGGIGVRGPGERQLEVDRRMVERRIFELKKSLERIESDRHTTVEGRMDRFPTVALVGYTNAGKSSLMNALTGADVSVRDRLFETLDTRTRRWELPDGQGVLLSDTVGFVRKFPHRLAASFHATLEEAREADLLLHVVDAASRQNEQEIGAVNEVLAEIGCKDKPTIYLLNKFDLVADASDVALLRKLVDEVICTSAVTGQGLDELRGRVAERLGAFRVELRVRAAMENGRLLAMLYENGHVVDRRCDGEEVECTVRISPQYVGMIRQMGGRLVEAVGAPGDPAAQGPAEPA